nr:MAG TPA: hypothetical protein [Caudoviricetes sp.]
MLSLYILNLQSKQDVYRVASLLKFDELSKVNRYKKKRIHRTSNQTKKRIPAPATSVTLGLSYHVLSVRLDFSQRLLTPAM